MTTTIRRTDTPIHYRVTLFDPAAHLFEVEMRVETVPVSMRESGVLLSLPTWIPGSYMIREFARHIVDIEAREDGHRVRLEKIDKHQWRTAACAGTLTVRYRVYAWDLSVRTAHFDDSHAFFNGTSLFLSVAELADQPCTVDIEAPTHLPEEVLLRRARVATTLPRDGARRWGFGRYRASSYDELIDHPVEIGDFSVYSFKVRDVPHHVVVSGRHDCDGKRLIADLGPICEAQIRLFEPRSAVAPFAEFLFLTQVVGDGYGGLEHRSSTALICARNDLPYPGMKDSTAGYRRFLGLASHEYFHSWHVKRIKPAAFVPYDLARESYTRLLWIFEGFTSYYDDLMLVRSGVISLEHYLGALGATISTVMRGPGRLRQSVAESSFDAWTKYYRQDEQSPNSIVSYYAKGAMVGLAIDLKLRAQSAGKYSLDDVMRALWQRFGRRFDTHAQGLAEHGFASLLEDVTGVDLRADLRRWSEGTRDIELAEMLVPFGVGLSLEPASSEPWLGARTTTRAGAVVLTTILSDGPAHKAGLSAGDEIVACNGLKVDDTGLKARLARCAPGDELSVHVFRRDELREYVVRLSAPPPTEARLSLAARRNATQHRLLRGWLGTVVGRLPAGPSAGPSAAPSAGPSARPLSRKSARTA